MSGDVVMHIFGVMTNMCLFWLQTLCVKLLALFMMLQLPYCFCAGFLLCVFEMNVMMRPSSHN